jgi:hypothetical protein
MPINWDEFEAVDESPAVDWSEFEVVPPLADLVDQRVNFPKSIQGIPPVAPEIYVPGVSYVPGLIKTPTNPFQPIPPVVSPAENVLNQLKAGTIEATRLPEKIMLAGTAGMGAPTMRQERRAFERAMLDPRYQDTLMQSKDPRKVESVLGPKARLESAMQIPRASQEAIVQEIIDTNKRVADLPRSQEQIAFDESKDWFGEWKKNPIQLTASIIARSLPTSIVGATGGPAGIGVSSALSEFSGVFLGEAERLGYDPKDPKQLTEFLNNEKAFKEAFGTAATRSAVIGRVDQYTAGMAGKWIEPALKQGLKQVSKATAKESAMQIAGGVGGEAVGNIAIGRAPDPRAMFMEGIAEFGQGPVEAAGNIRSEMKSRFKAIAPPERSIDWMEKELKAGRAVGTDPAYEVGLQVRSIADLERLLKIREKMYAGMREAIKKGNISKASQIGLQTQIPQEAIEAATFIGEKTHPNLPPERPLDLRTNPEVKEWLRKNMGRFELGEAGLEKWTEQLEETKPTPEAPKPEAPSEPIPQAEPTPASIPAPADGTVRIYHGEGGAGGAGYSGLHWATKQKYVTGFGSKQSYIDLPQSVYDKIKAEAVARGKPNDLDLTKYPEWRKKEQPIEEPLAPEVSETSFISKEVTEAGKGRLNEAELEEFGQLLDRETFNMLDVAQSKRLEALRQKTQAPEISPAPEVPLPAKPPEAAVPPTAPPEPSAPAEPKPVTPVVTELQATEVMPPGPGAASPSEFSQRQIEASRTPLPPPKDTDPGVPVDGGDMPTPDVVRKARDFNTLNRFNSGQFSFYFGRLGAAAKAAWERMALGEFSMREAIQRDTMAYVDEPLRKLPREFRKDGGKLFAELLDGRTLDSIEAEYASKPNGNVVIEQARKVKTRLEEIRTTIRDVKRNSYHGYLMSMDKAMLEKLYQENIFNDTQGKPKEALADALSRDQFPDDWGIADGSYLPHMFFGQWKITARVPGMEQPQFITRAKTPAEAKARIFELTQRNPEYKQANFTIEQDMVIPADMIRLGDGQFWKLISQMKERAQSEMNPKEAIQGIIGKKSSKVKWFGNSLRRTGALGYSKQYRQLMTAYLSGFHRWKELTAMNREVQPLIEQVRKEGRRNAADRLQDLMDNLWGKPSQMTLDFDAFMRDIPIVRDIVKPMALDRWARFINTTVTNLALRTARFITVNRLQPLQGLYPMIGEKLMVRAKILQHSAEGKKLLDEAGVTFDVGQYAGEISGISKASRAMERLTGEKSNQELAFLGMYLHGIEKGMDKSGAINYAKLRGQLMTQFSPLVVDVPPIMEGPLGRVTFQFKRFPIKQMELLTQMAVDRNIPGLVRYFAVMSAMGGISLMMKQAYTDKEKRLKVKRTLNKAVGEKKADYLFYGLPGLIGADLSGSLVLGDEPFGSNFPEKLGRTVMGPAPTMLYETGKAIGTPAREAMDSGEKLMAVARKFPSLRQLVDLYDLKKGNLDITSPDGETKYKRKMRDVILGMGSFRSANEANIQLAVNGAMEIDKESSKLKNALWVATQSKNSDQVKAARNDIKNFNERWPEVAITPSELQGYFQYRKGNQPKTDTERAMGKKYRVLMPR